MKLVFNPSGTQVHKEIFRLRFDWMPDETDEAYKVHYVYVPVIPESGYPGLVDKDGNPVDQKAYDEWLAGLPHIRRVNPCLCQFVTMPETVTLSDIDAWMEMKLDRDTPATLDNLWKMYAEKALVKPISDYISPAFKDRGAYTTAKVLTKDYVDLVATVNQRLCPDGIPIVKSLGGDGVALDIEPQSIDMGGGATDRALTVYISTGYTMVDINNPANATGTLDSFAIWLNQQCQNVLMGTAYGSGTSWTGRDFFTWGTVAAGSEQVATGKSVSVETDDCIHFYGTTGYIDANTSGGAGAYSAAGDQISDHGTDTYTAHSGWVLSFYATGTESGTGWGGEFCGVSVAEFDGVTPAEIDGV